MSAAFSLHAKAAVVFVSLVPVVQGFPSPKAHRFFLLVFPGNCPPIFV